MEKLKQLIDIINQMKNASKNGMKIDNSQKIYYTLGLLKEIYGEQINSGILREVVRKTKEIIFDDDVNLEFVQLNDKFGITIKGENKIGNIVAQLSNDEKIYRGDINIKNNNSIEKISFSDNICEIESNYEKNTINFDEDGIETERKIIKYKDREHQKVDNMISLSRDKDNFNILHVQDYYNGDLRNYDAQIATKIYSLGFSYNEHKLYDINENVQEFINEDLENSVDYKYFPELKETILKKTGNKIK